MSRPGVRIRLNSRSIAASSGLTYLPHTGNIQFETATVYGFRTARRHGGCLGTMPKVDKRILVSGQVFRLAFHFEYGGGRLKRMGPRILEYLLRCGNRPLQVLIRCALDVD